MQWWVAMGEALEKGFHVQTDHFSGFCFVMEVSRHKSFFCPPPSPRRHGNKAAWCVWWEIVDGWCWYLLQMLHQVSILGDCGSLAATVQNPKVTCLLGSAQLAADVL